ncbi:uncharacterized protein AMSG_06499 [Thecamonas trahens ATCC 50062]|uniref:Uncharacterized protein n=1 Tax=Thecamonas trahens ATCC 50062 TaxID=461836 RepID=A0A0L0DFS7_THETB|nr:hypothetical protein AMSG_06499 [Thecamonas trahens ATCC 50062]KNC51149.1 hypothetical protein AMSG_06499 [Thecamonas trahens ATCC 50062]|eukprot:XP_013756351.1 hypothetical protein AMSG_06499 [Thecamonas trahens ATCC 50062]
MTHRPAQYASFLPRVVGRAAVIGPAVAAEPDLARLTTDDLVSRLLVTNETLRTANDRLTAELDMAQKSAGTAERAKAALARLAADYERRRPKAQKKAQAQAKTKAKSRRVGAVDRVADNPDSETSAVVSSGSDGSRTGEGNARTIHDANRRPPSIISRLSDSFTLEPVREVSGILEEGGEAAAAEAVGGAKTTGRLMSRSNFSRSKTWSQALVADDNHRSSSQETTRPESNQGSGSSSSCTSSTSASYSYHSYEESYEASGAEETVMVMPSVSAATTGANSIVSGGGGVSPEALAEVQEALERVQGERDSLRLRYESVLAHYENAYKQLSEMQRKLREAEMREQAKADNFRIRLGAMEARASAGRRMSISIGSTSRTGLPSLTSLPPLSARSQRSAEEACGGEGTEMTAAEMTAAMTEAATEANDRADRLSSENARLEGEVTYC